MTASGVEQIFPLSPMQRGMLFHTLKEPGSGVYLEQFRFRIEGLDAATFRRAWAHVVACYPALRTSVVGTGRREPAQVVWSEIELPWAEHDARELAPDEQEAWIRSHLERERERGFTFDEKSLTRFMLVRCGESTYEFLWTIHHIVLDGWSGAIVRSAAFSCYETLLRGETPKLVAPRPFQDYIAWQHDQDVSKAESYWRRHLAGLPDPVTIDGGEVERSVTNYDEVEIRLSEALTGALRESAARNKITLNTIVQAAWALGLSRGSGQEDIVFGAVVAGRPEELDGAESMVGMFVNTLPCRIAVPPDARLGDWLRSINAQQWEQRAFEHSPLWDVHRWSGRPAGAPLFESLYVFENYPGGEKGESSIVVQAKPPLERVGYPVMLLVGPTRELILKLVYDADRYDRATVVRALDDLRMILRATAEPDDPALRSILAARSGEQRQIIDEWNRTERPYPAEQCLHELVERQADRMPERVAVVSGDVHLSYRDLDERANRLARHLGGLGIGGNDLVGLCVERSADMLVGLLGILKTGAAYVPIDPAFPSDRIAHMLADAAVGAVVTHEAAAMVFDVEHVVDLDRDRAALDALPSTRPAAGTRSDELAYVIYTSGSTGQPKGVEIPHRAVVNFLESMRHEPGLDASDVLLAVTTLSFDIAVLELLLPLLVGARVVLAPREQAADGYALQRLLTGERVTVMQATPATWQMLIQTEWPGDPKLKMLCGGEALPRVLANALLERGGELWNMYGPTETTIWSSIARVQPGRRPVTLGRPIANTQLHVLDERLEPVPIGVAGELYIGGDGLARGYHGRPDLTAERFVADPWHAASGRRLYRTGDLVRFEADGELRFLGRVDHQVKVRGFRIELGEIEASLERHPWAQQAVAVVRGDRPDDRRLVAYIVPNREGEADEAASLLPRWQSVWDGAYSEEREEAVDPTFDIRGWNSSYTSEAIPADEMRAWVEETVDVIRSRSPQRVLEMGCGTGLLLFRIAPHCSSYVATDFSKVAIDRVAGHLDTRGLASTVTLMNRPAHDVSGLTDERFDTVILNSVIQYFPSVDYLVDVLAGAVDCTAPGGCVIVGDVRNLKLLEAYHASVQAHTAPDEMSLGELRRQVRRRMMQEEELVVDPTFFGALKQRVPRISHVEIRPKHGTVRNELTKFRYDVILHVEREQAGAAVDRVSWSDDVASLASLGERLRCAPDRAIEIVGIPNARTAEDVRLVRALRNGEADAVLGTVRAASDEPIAAVDPAAVVALGHELDRRVELSWTRTCDDGRFDVRFVPTDAPETPFGAEPAGEPASWERYTNHPVRASRTLQLAPVLRKWLAESLPDYMVPSSFVMLDEMPLTANGKVDRRTLLTDAYAPLELRAAYAPPRTAEEEVLCAIWSDVLGISRPGIHDDFFQLGGHSLTATQLVSRIREALRIELPVRSVFENPTIAALADVLKRRDDAADTTARIVPVPRDDALPLSFAQQRLWFLDQLDVGPTYNLGGGFRLSGPLDIEALERSIDAIVARHEVLRTCFPSAGGRPTQRIVPEVHVPLELVDLTSSPADAREAETQRCHDHQVRRPFDLAAGPLLRATLVRLEPETHVLLLAVHHIAFDGWSLGILSRDLAAFYRAFVAGETPELPALPIQYLDFAQWQNDRLRGDVLDAQLAFWREELAGVAPLELPTDRPRGATRSFEARGRNFKIDAQTSDAIQTLSRRHGVTPAMILQACFAVLLGRYSGQTDVIVASPIANRNRREIEGLIGFFVNTLLLRTDCSGNPTFVELLDRARERSLAAYEHQDLPFEKLVEELQPERDLARSPLAQVLFVMQNAAPFALELPGLAVRPFMVEPHASTFDLELHVGAVGGVFAGSFRYNCALFDDATIARMAEHFRTLLAGAMADPRTQISTLPLLAPAERHELLVEWNDTDRPGAADGCIHELVERQALATPATTAVRHGEQTLSYTELDARANQLAHHLREQGVGADGRVAILLERSMDVVVALLATLKAGGAYVPIDPTLPRDRIAFMLEDCDATVILTLASALDALPETRSRVVCLDRDADVIARMPQAAVGGGVTPAHLAYVLYTSGSTGRPKGVAMPHGALVNLLRWQIDVSPSGAPDRTAQFGTLSFDQHFLDIFATLAVGGAVLIVSEEERRDPAALLRFLEANQVTRMFMPYVALRQMAEVAEAIDVVPTSLRLVISAGEALQITPAIAEFFARIPDCVLCNEYGPAETHVVTALDLTAPTDAWPTLPSVGRPIINTSVYILDERLEPVPVGVPGELYLGGAQVARGYLGRPALTAERFVPDPFAGAPGARLYKTGDVARYRADGQVEFLGRADFQVKIRGFRIEPGEVEATAMRHDDVKHAVVIAREDRPGVRRLVLYAVPEANRTIARGDLRRFLQERLPDYMVPARVMILDALPLTPIGKVDRLALPAPSDTGAEGDAVAPRNLTEEILAGIWADVLGVASPGVHDGFFELGGHSLLATQVASRVRSLMDVELPVRAVFENQTIAELARCIERLAGETPPPPLVRASRDGPMPVSSGQRRLWLLDQLGAGTAYNLPSALRLRGRLDREALERSLAELVRRHETLRTTFAVRDGEPVQMIAEPGPVALPVEDLRGLPVETREAAAERVAAAEFERPFDLGRDALLRAKLVCLDDGDHVLVLTIHHIVADGWSLGVLRRELGIIYGALVRGESSPLDELAIQYADFAAWERTRHDETRYDAQLAYWKTRLAGVAPLGLPTDRPRPAIQTYAGGIETLHLPNELSNAIRRLGDTENTTLFMTLLAAFEVLLARYAGADDVVVGTAVANRTMVELEDLVGFFINTLVLRTDLSGDPSFRDVLTRVRESALGAYQHQDVSFETLVDELEPERDPGRNPLYQVAFALQNAPRGALELPDLTIDAFRAGAVTTRHDLELHGWEDAEGGLHFAFIYNADLFDATTIRRMAEHFHVLLRAGAGDPSERVGSLDLLTSAERDTVVTAWNETSRPYPTDVLLHELCEAQATRTPTAIAVEFEDTSLTYDVFARRTNKLARYLQERGVGPEVPVGIAADRSLELVVGLHAIVKAGGAYVPLDPAYPAERLAQIAHETRMPVVLTQSHLRDGLPPLPAEVLCLDTQWDEVAQASDEPVTSDVRPENLAYIIYTSGSTGQPKGVMNTHAGICNRLLWMQEAYGLTDADRVLQKTPFSFDVSVWEFFWPLMTGARLVVARPDGHKDPAYLARTIDRCGITTLHFVPSMLKSFLTAADGGSLASLDRIICSGEALPSQIVNACLAKIDAELHNLYGPTEAAIDVTAWPCRTVEPGAAVPIGRPIANTQVYLLDPALRPVPVGVPGELCIGGVQVARGYVERPALTAERYVPDPFGPPGTRLYRTGDTARFRHDGTIEFLGRIDDQVKIRGFRIELGEIEAVLGEHPAVREAVAVVRDHGDDDKQLVAYAVPDENEARPVRRLLRLRDAGRLDEHETYELPNGMTVVHLNRNETEFLYEEIFEHAEYARHGIELDANACVFDVGANIGMFSLAIAKQCPNARIYAFEPIPNLCEILRMNAEIHGLDAEVLEYGVAAANGHAEFVYYPNVSILSGLYADESAERAVVKSFVRQQRGASEAAPVSEAMLDELLTERLAARSVTCALRTISDVIRANDVERIDLLKVDVEKAELDVLLGIEDDHWSRIRQLAIEVHDTDGRLDAVHTLLTRHGYDVAIEQETGLEQTDLHVVYARRPGMAAAPRHAPANGTARWASDARLADALREWLEARLPAYMVPSAIGLLDHVPLTANGKIDRKALPAPDVHGDRDPYVAPRTPVEEKLAEIWCAVLQRDQVSVTTSFFRLGGDSLLSIRAVTLANEAGLRLGAMDMFRHQTIAELAAVVGTGPVIEAEQDAVVGEVPLTPIERWFVTQEQPEPQHFNQSVLVEVRRRIAPETCRNVVARLLEHHDALRLRLTRARNAWHQTITPPGDDVPFEAVDLSTHPAAERAAALTAEAARRQASLDLERGPLVRVVLFDLGPAEAQRLLIVAHHLVIDGVSWRILLEDLERGIGQVESGETIGLPAKTTSFRQWSDRLQSFAQTPAVTDELDAWRRLPWDEAADLPIDHEQGAVTAAGQDHVRTMLSAERTRALLQDVPGAYNTEINDVLLTALVMAFGAWTGRSSVLVDLEGHGREPLFDDMDVSRTVGWFTTVYPVVLAIDDPGRPGAAIKSVKEQLRSVPRRGIGYGLLRYLRSDDVAATMAALPRPRVSFNYLGQTDQVLGGDGLFSPASEPAGAMTSPVNRPPYLLDVSGSVSGGRLHLAVGYNTGRHDRATIERVLEHFVRAIDGLIGHCLAPDAGGVTPSDFPLAEVDQSALDHLLERWDRDAIEDVLRLSPMQQGIVYHALADPASGVYILQIRQQLQGFDRATYMAAWQHVIDRHPALRTSIAGIAQATPVQLVLRRVDVPIETHDCSALSADEQQAWLDRHLREDLRRGMDLGDPPLMRLAMIDLGGGRAECIWSFHHVVLDGWSFAAVLRDVIQCYDALRHGKAPDLPAPPPYRDYVRWLGEQDLETAELYWRRTLRGLDAPTPLAAPPSSADEVTAYEEHTVTLSRRATERLRRLAQERSVTLNTVAVGAWAILHARYAGSPDVVFGTTVSGRAAPVDGIESMVGLFINTLPLRVHVADDEPVGSWLVDLQSHVSEQRAYEHSPLWQVHQWSGLAADVPLFDTIVVFENYPIDASAVERWSEHKVRWAYGMERTGYPLLVSVVPGGEMVVRFTYQRDRFDADAIARMAARYLAILERIADETETPPPHLSRATGDERRRLLVEWNDTACDRPLDATIHGLVAAQVASTPDAIAVTFGDRSVTYAELDAHAERVADHLAQLGVGTETIVGLCAERSVEMLVGMLGILKAGAAYVPIDPQLPTSRLAFMVEESRPRVVLAHTTDQNETLAASASVVGARVVPIASIGAEGAAPKRPPLAVHPDALAYVIYTSGSTGKPKGVQVTHDNVVNFLKSMQQSPGMDMGDTLLAVTTLSFDIAGLELFLPLIVGARVVIASREIAADGHALARTLAAERVTVMQATPATWQMLWQTAWDGDPKLKILCGGEALPATLAAALVDRGCALWNMYGPTETTIWSSIARIDAGAPDVTLGRPIANTQLYVLDDRLEPVPIGVTGELYIGGAGVARGYLDRPALTAERFVPDPFASAPGARIYRTGDLVRYRSDGDLDFVGRADTQVKLRGHRIELGEIETVAVGHEAVEQAVALVREDRPQDRRLVLYVVPRGDAPSVAELRRHIATRLPDAMVPSAYVVLDAFPMTANRKVDRRVLPAPEQTRAALDQAYVAPSSRTETTLCEIWSEVLGLDRVGVADDFFELGGHSLLALKVTARIQATFDLEFDLPRFLRTRTIGEAAEMIDALLWSKRGREASVTEPAAEIEEGTL